MNSTTERMPLMRARRKDVRLKVLPQLDAMLDLPKKPIARPQQIGIAVATFAALAVLFALRAMGRGYASWTVPRLS